ncbi:hypothetical protein [Kutzneria kofuensis]|uniref:hypothetical protein n=1 Tax=Kutzneria kofuensis TaxID=103725 RepID=UPI0031F17385
MTARSVGLPSTVRGDGLPERVTIWEVGARDGLQNESSVVDVAVKLEFLDRLADAGLSVLEATSFVHPKWVPQLADAEQLLAGLKQREGVSYRCSCPTSAAWTGRWPRASGTSRSSAAPPRRSPTRT